MNLTPEQLAYLKSLESPKKRRKFMLDCLVENALGESVKLIYGNLDLLNQTYTAPRTFENTEEAKKESNLVGLLSFCGVSEEQMKNSVFCESAKSNYNSEEIEIAKSLNSEREEKKWTDEDMRKAYLTAIIDWLASEQERKGFDPEVLFKKYLNRLKND